MDLLDKCVFVILVEFLHDGGECAVCKHVTRCQWCVYKPWAYTVHPDTLLRVVFWCLEQNVS